MGRRAWPVLWRGALMLVAVWLLALADVGLPAPKRPPAPEPATTAVLRKPSYGGPAINAASGAGPQIAVDGAVLWVTYTLADAAGSRILLARSDDVGRTFAPPEPVLPEVPRLLQPALALESPGQPPVIGCVVHRAGTLDSADSSTERQPSGTSLALLRHRNGEWAIDGATLGSPAGSSYSSPHPLVGPDGAVSVLFQETQARTRDHLGCWVVDGGAVVPVDDDPSGAPKLGFSALWADGTLHVAYADGRDNPGQGAYLYYTASADPRQGFARSRRLDPPHPRAWQAPPQLAAQGGLLLIGSTALTHRYFPRAYRDKLRRHRVAGLYQALAYSREPVVWWSTDNGASFHRTDGIDDQDIEVSAGAVFALPRDGRVAAVWSESRPVTRPPDLRWATAGGLSHRFTATRAFNPAPGDNSAEVLYDAVWLPDGALAALYKDMTPDGSAGLYLARSEPLE